MLTEQFPASAVATAILFFPGLHGVDQWDAMDETASEVAVPFVRASSVKLSFGDIQGLALRQAFLEGSTVLNPPVFVKVEINATVENQKPAELVYELRRISGLTWTQIAEIFGVSAHAPYLWASGSKVSAENHKRLGQVTTALRFIDRGSAEENRNLLLGSARPGQTYLDLLRSGECDLVQEIAGQGAGHPFFGAALTQDAEKFNAPTHWGNALEASIGIDETEILHLNQPKPRRGKARRSKV